jgi:hypothetical protein
MSEEYNWCLNSIKRKIFFIFVIISQRERTSSKRKILTNSMKISIRSFLFHNLSRLKKVERSRST